jgi:O-antigen/teichoic acid export membrane protein
MSKSGNTAAKFNSDLIWNVVCFGFIAAAGILLNILLVKCYDKNALGVFNQVYAVYLLLSQLAVAGIHLSVQYYVPKHQFEKHNVVQILQSAIYTSTITSIITILAGYAMAGFIAELLNSPWVEDGILYAVWGLLFFSWNKILIAVLNGERKMKAFAVFQLLRFVFILAFFIILFINQYHYKYIPSILALSEAALFVLLVIYMISYFKPVSFKKLKLFTRLHIAFGRKSMIGNLIMDVNTKVDIFILGVFHGDAIVGVYSFAATIAEGFVLFPSLLRNNINPVITMAHHKKSHGLLFKVFKRTRRSFYKLIVSLAVLSMLFYPAVPYIFGFEEWIETWIVYSVLIAGIIISAGYQPFLLFFNQIGEPGKQTLFLFIIFISNIVFNLILVPTFHIYGSAIGTSLSFVIQMLLFIAMTKSVFHGKNK